MPANSRAAKAEAAHPPERRGPGAPLGGATISRDEIIRVGLQLARTKPLQEVSIVMVARALNVTPATIHYYIQGRRKLTAAIVNRFYQRLVRKWPKPTGDFETDAWAMASTMFGHFVAYPGMAAYAQAHNRFEAFADVPEGERNYGIESVELVTGVVRQAGRSPDVTGVYCHFLTEFIIGSAHGAAVLGYPSQHGATLQAKVQALDPAKFPHIAWSNRIHENFDAKTAFRMGCNLFISGLGHGGPPPGAPGSE